MLYNKGLDALANIATAGFSWLLLQGTGYVFNRGDDFVVDLDPASNEVTVAGYGRLLFAGGTRTVNDTLNRVEYRATNPDFGSLDPGESVTALVLVQNVTDDDDSILVGYYNFASIDSGDMTPFVIEFTDNMLAYTDEVP